MHKKNIVILKISALIASLLPIEVCKLLLPKRVCEITKSVLKSILQLGRSFVKDLKNLKGYKNIFVVTKNSIVVKINCNFHRFLPANI